jgi:hypothetical protein
MTNHLSQGMEYMYTEEREVRAPAWHVLLNAYAQVHAQRAESSPVATCVRV